MCTRKHYISSGFGATCRTKKTKHKNAPFTRVSLFGGFGCVRPRTLFRAFSGFCLVFFWVLFSCFSGGFFLFFFFLFLLIILLLLFLLLLPPFSSSSLLLLPFSSFPFSFFFNLITLNFSFSFISFLFFFP